MKQVGEGYWGLLPEQAVAVHAQQQQQQLDQSRSDVNHQPSSEAAGIGRSWVQSMFSRDRAVQTHSATAGRPRGSQSVLGFWLTHFSPYPVLLSTIMHQAKAGC